MPVKTRDVKIPASNFEGTIGLQYLFEKSGVNPDFITITGGARHGDYHKEEMSKTPNSNHNSGNGFDFGGKANDSENEKLIKWLTNSDEGKKFAKDWNLEIITGDKYENGHFHIGFRRGLENKSDEVKNIYAENKPKWIETYGENGLADFSKIDWKNLEGPIKEEYVNPDYFNSKGGNIKNKKEYKESDMPQKNQIKQEDWNTVSEEEKAKVLDKYAAFDKKYREAKTDEERQAAKDEIKDIRQKYGPKAYANFKQKAMAENTKAELEKYGLDEVEGLSKQIEDLETSKQTLVAGKDDKAIAEIDKEIEGIQETVEDLYIKADYLKKTEDFESLKAKAEGGEKFTPEEKEKYDALSKQLPETAAWWKSQQSQHSQWKDSETHTAALMDRIAKGEDIHPYLFKTTVGEYAKAQKESGEYTGILSDYDIDQGIETVKYGFMDGLASSLDSRVPGLGTAFLASTDWLRKSARNKQLFNGPKQADDAYAMRLRGEDALDEYISGSDKLGDNIPREEAYYQSGPSNLLTEDDFNFPENEDGSGGGDGEGGEGGNGGNSESGGSKAPGNGKQSANVPVDPFETSNPFKFDDTRGTLFEQAGGLDSVMGMVQAGMGLRDSGEIDIPEEQMINDMTNNHIQQVLRLKEIGMPLVDQANMRESMDNAFMSAKRAIMDASGGNRAQALSAVSNLGASRQRTALNVEIEKSKGRQKALTDYGELLKYVNDFQATEGRLHDKRTYEVQKAKKEASGKLVASGIEGIMQAVNNDKLYGKGSAYDMTNKYTEWFLTGGANMEGDYQTGLDSTLSKMDEVSGEQREPEPNNMDFSAATVLMNQGFISEAKQGLSEINKMVDQETLSKKVTLENQQDKLLLEMSNDPIVNANPFK